LIILTKEKGSATCYPKFYRYPFSTIRRANFGGGEYFGGYYGGPLFRSWVLVEKAAFGKKEGIVKGLFAEA